MIFAAEDTTATTTTYANTKWKASFCSIEPSENMMSITMRIYDFYLMREDKIRYNWMLIDVVDLMLQAGHRVLPKVILLSISSSLLAPFLTYFQSSSGPLPTNFRSPSGRLLVPFLIYFRSTSYCFLIHFQSIKI